jgi:hypothetical protein
MEGTLGPLISGFFEIFSVDFVTEDPQTRHLVAFALILEPQTGQVDDCSIFLFVVILIPV